MSDNQNGAINSVIYRTPPPPPPSSSSPSPHTNSIAKSNDLNRTTTPPQPPIRTNVPTLSRNSSQSEEKPTSLTSNVISHSMYSTSSNGKNSKDTPPTPPSRMINETATNAVARLVYKSAMTGSVQSLNNNVNVTAINSNDAQNDDQLMANLSQQIKNLTTNDSNKTPPNLHHLNNIKEIAGSSASNMSNKTSDAVITNTLINSSHQSQTNKNSPIAPPSLSLKSFNNTSTKNSKARIPWTFLDGECLVGKDEDGSTPDSIHNSSTSIIFVLPDNRGVRGRLFISNFRVYFRSADELNIIIDLPLGLISRIEKIGHQSARQTNFYGFLISCKNGRRLRFACSLNDENNTSRKQIFELIQRYAFPISNQLDYFAYSYRPNSNAFSDNSGWFVYDAKQEYERIGISKSSDWRFTSINQHFKFCDTYPKVLVVPHSVTDDDLRQIGEFRSKHRIPVVSWLKFDSRKNSVALMRSSQPLVGLTNKRNEKDESYLYCIYKMNTINSLDKLFIMDARPLVNAMANRTTGGGYENDDNYKDCEINFLNIQNIHVMRESLRKIFDMGMPNSNFHHNSSSITNGANIQNRSTNANGINNLIHFSLNGGGNSTNNSNNSNLLNDDKNYFVNLENSKWLEHIRLLLNGALRIVKYIHDRNASVLVHCSDGWDRTSQLTSLSMLMMDKFYRTLKGFQVLVEKEWISFGHRFGIRMGHGSDKHSDQDRSPIFVQFIDAVWQIMQQNSKVFEFNEKFLLTILNNMYTCQFGTFLYNNELEREKHEVRLKTISLWSYINSYKNEFKNSAYVEYDGVVECSTSLASLQLWTAYYFQYKEVIDDSLNEATINSSISALNQNTSSNNAENTLTMTNPLPSKLFGPTFFHQVVNQMKASVRNYAAQEPELIKYRASVQQADISN